VDTTRIEPIPHYREFVVSKPPSVNSMYRFANIKGRLVSYMTKLGKDWFSKELPKIKSPIPSIEDPVMVGLVLFTTRMTQDLDNIFKASMDLLQKGGVLINDNQIVRITAEKRKVSTKVEECVQIFVHVLPQSSIHPRSRLA